jgi:hypothetical protein
MTHSGAVDIVVALPAHNESALITDCLRSVGRAVEAAQAAGVVRRARVAVAAHRCTDDTAARSSAALADARGTISAVVTVENEAVAVGTVRTRLINAAAAQAPALAPDAWVFSTDADTVVPIDWVTATLQRADAARADLVLGLADLDDWPVDATTLAAYEQIIANGLTAGGHRHAYAANLAIRLSAFRAVGGFPGSPHGEEHGLAAACHTAGLTVLSTLAPRVQTSARMPGRAPNGLGALLARLHDDSADSLAS